MQPWRCASHLNKGIMTQHSTLLSRCLTIALFVARVPVFAGSVPGIKNFDQVDAHVYRGGQPTDEGFRYLANLGVKTIIDLREAGVRSQAEERAVTASGMKYVSVPMTGLIPPTEAETTKLLALMEDTNSGPVFVHCQHGADRTGAVIAAYHIDHDQWDSRRALQDAKAHSMSPFQLPRQAYIRNFRSRTVEAQATTATATAASTTSDPRPVAATLAN
jgi:tyrosine-protein phosphatase SIW14